MKKNSWLTDEGSLTLLMEKCNQGPIDVHVNQAGFAPTQVEERRWLNLKQRQWAFLREVELYGKNQQLWLWARTIIPKSTLRGRANRLKMLKAKPLGPLLFKKLGAHRIFMELEHKACHHPVSSQGQKLWHRRSLFLLSEGPLLVTEIFLPDNPVYEYY